MLRGKTGLSGSPQANLLGWFVGWLELGERRVFFATLKERESALAKISSQVMIPD